MNDNVSYATLVKRLFLFNNSYIPFLEKVATYVVYFVLECIIHSYNSKKQKVLVRYVLYYEKIFGTVFYIPLVLTVIVP
jgi:hypothetical protein